MRLVERKSLLITGRKSLESMHQLLVSDSVPCVSFLRQSLVLWRWVFKLFSLLTSLEFYRIGVLMHGRDRITVPQQQLLLIFPVLVPLSWVKEDLDISSLISGSTVILVWSSFSKSSSLRSFSWGLRLFFVCLFKQPNPLPWNLTWGFGSGKVGKIYAPYPHHKVTEVVFTTDAIRVFCLFIMKRIHCSIRRMLLHGYDSIVVYSLNVK